jgi:putative transposase
MSIQHKAFRFALVPTRSQSASLNRFADARRCVYNWALERSRVHYAVNGQSITATQLFRELTELKRRPDHGWLREIDSQLLQQAIWDLRQAYTNFFDRRAPYPSFKSRKRDPQRFRIPQRVRLVGKRIYVPKIGWVKVRLSRPVDLPTRAATFKRDPTGKWFVTLVSQFECPDPRPLDRSSRCVGIDLGIKTFAVFSDGRRLHRQPVGEARLRRLRRAHRALSRKSRGSRNRTKARLRLARAYRRAADERHDFLHKLTTMLIREYDFLSVEDLGVRGLARTKLARRLHEAGLSEFRRQLTYKASWHGKTVVAVDRFFPSSKRCPECAGVKRDLSVSQREWTCHGCGARHDRDLAAARNILAEGLRVAAGHADTENACGDRVRLPMEATVEEAGTPAS